MSEAGRAERQARQRGKTFAVREAMLLCDARRVCGEARRRAGANPAREGVGGGTVGGGGKGREGDRKPNALTGRGHCCVVYSSLVQPEMAEINSEQVKDNDARVQRGEGRVDIATVRERKMVCARCIHVYTYL